jgi:hypothetical protein
MRHRFTWIAILPALCASALCADAGYAGAQACGSCHPAQFAGQSGSGHAQALRRATEHVLAASFTPPEPLQRPPNFHFRFVRTLQGIQAQADDSKYLIRLPVDWAFGAGAHAVTFVGKASGELYIEHSFSYYPDSRSFDITPQHERLPAKTLHEAMGQAFRIQGPGPTIQDCFQCHSTGPVSVSANHEIEVSEQGVRCEVCHGPGNAHVLAARRGDLRQAKALIQNPKALPAGELNRFCGKCHRFPTGDPGTTDWNDPWNVRHQPPYLQQSQCFQKSGGALSCLTCHDPHEKLRRNDAAYYRQKCSSCHGRSARPPKEVCNSQESADCTHCHMPAVAVNSRLKFKNHWIGIYRNGAMLQPLSSGQGPRR